MDLDGAQEDEASHADRRRGLGQAAGARHVDVLEGPPRLVRAAVSRGYPGGEVNHGVDAVARHIPVDCGADVGDEQGLDRYPLGRVAPRRRRHRQPCRCQVAAQRAADEPVRSGHKDVHHAALPPDWGQPSGVRPHRRRRGGPRSPPPRSSSHRW